MFTAIDESGDTGQVALGGTSMFHLAGVVWPSIEEVGRFRVEVKAVRETLGLKRDYEFKFSKTHHRENVRAAFFETALRTKFAFTFCTVDKTADDWRRAAPPAILRACLVDTVVWLAPLYQNGEVGMVVLDDNEDEAYLAEARTQFRLIGSADVQLRDSRRDEAIQLADMICGATARHIVEGDPEWFRLIRSRAVGPGFTMIR